MSDTVKPYESGGWAFPGNARKAHYFPAGEVFALCGTWGFYAGPRENNNHHSTDNCMQCKKLVIKQGLDQAMSERS